jgi:hypothetical protein
MVSSACFAPAMPLPLRASNEVRLEIYLMYVQPITDGYD